MWGRKGDTCWCLFQEKSVHRLPVTNETNIKKIRVIEKGNIFFIILCWGTHRHFPGAPQNYAQKYSVN